MKVPLPVIFYTCSCLLPAVSQPTRLRHGRLRPRLPQPLPANGRHLHAIASLPYASRGGISTTPAPPILPCTPSRLTRLLMPGALRRLLTSRAVFCPPLCKRSTTQIYRVSIFSASFRDRRGFVAPAEEHLFAVLWLSVCVVRLAASSEIMHLSVCLQHM